MHIAVHVRNFLSYLAVKGAINVNYHNYSVDKETVMMMMTAVVAITITSNSSTTIITATVS